MCFEFTFYFYSFFLYYIYISVAIPGPNCYSYCCSRSGVLFGDWGGGGGVVFIKFWGDGHEDEDEDEDEGGGRIQTDKVNEWLCGRIRILRLGTRLRLWG